MVELGVHPLTLFMFLCRASFYNNYNRQQAATTLIRSGHTAHRGGDPEFLTGMHRYVYGNIRLFSVYIYNYRTVYRHRAHRGGRTLRRRVSRLLAVPYRQ